MFAKVSGRARETALTIAGSATECATGGVGPSPQQSSYNCREAAWFNEPSRKLSCRICVWIRIPTRATWADMTRLYFAPCSTELEIGLAGARHPGRVPDESIETGCGLVYRHRPRAFVEEPQGNGVGVESEVRRRSDRWPRVPSGPTDADLVHLADEAPTSGA